MVTTTDLQLSPITSDDVTRVAEFLHLQLNSRLSSGEWAAAMVPPWDVASPNHGFMLTQDGVVVGANLAFYSERTIAGRREAFCNLGALCVREDLRSHTFRLIRALLKQSGYHFTDLSPSGNVVELDKRLGFSLLDTSTTLAPNVPWPPSRQLRVIADVAEIERRLEGPSLDIFRDHRGARAARHLLVTRQDEQCYVIYRRDRRKNLPLFASILYVSNPSLYQSAARHIGRHLLRHGLPATLSEQRVVGCTPSPGWSLAAPRSKLYKSTTLSDTDIDYLYSELTCVSW